MGTARQKDHRARLKNRFIKEGLDNMESQYVLELLLFFGIPQKDTKDIAYELLEHFGSIKAVFEAPYEELLKVNGIGSHTATLIKLIPNISRYYLNEEIQGITILNSSLLVGEYLVPKFIGLKNEVVYLLCLDCKKKVLLCKPISEGTVNSSTITIRKIVEHAVRVNADSVVIAHNHPAGFALPSMSDVDTTRALRSALLKLDVTLIDHIIVANNDFVSMADSGFI